jgi:hypothetical protein
MMRVEEKCCCQTKTLIKPVKGIMELRAALEALLTEAQTISERCEQVHGHAASRPLALRAAPPVARLRTSERTSRGRCRERAAVPTVPGASERRYAPRVGPWQLPNGQHGAWHGCGGLRQETRATLLRVSGAMQSGVHLSTWLSRTRRWLACSAKAPLEAEEECMASGALTGAVQRVDGRVTASRTASAVRGHRDLARGG